ncbi:MAG: SIR2 family protein, partial [Anaerolineae bacterium]
MSTTLGERDWRLLLRRIAAGKCTPFLGAGACFGTLPLGSDIANEWSGAHQYPLEDSHDLVRVAQFLAVQYDPVFPKEELLKEFENVEAPDFTDPDEPHAVLADLPLPVYITTNYDDFMVRALESRDRHPRRELCRWNTLLKDRASVLESGNGLSPTVANPVVFHLHGHNEVPESLVLSEDDYLDFLVNLSKDQELLPPRIQGAMAGTSLLFLGYRIADWDFRVLFRSLISYLEKSTKRAHVSVHLVPGGDRISPAQREKAQEYLDSYFDEL